MRLEDIVRTNTVLSFDQLKSDPQLVAQIQQILVNGGYLPDRDSKGTSSVDGDLGEKTRAALSLFCEAVLINCMQTGQFGRTFAQRLLDFASPSNTTIVSPTATITAGLVAPMFPGASRSNIATHLPNVLLALRELGLGDKTMINMALSTIRAETAGFMPISEFQSKYNTDPGQHPFNKYDNRTVLGNRGRPDGANFKGRGFVQLTGRDNYDRIGRQIGVDLINNPQLANESLVAAKILARFLKNKESAIRNAIAVNDLALARRAVNGGSHGLDAFKEAFNKGRNILPG